MSNKYDSLFAEIDNNINWIVLTNDKSMFAVIKKQLRDLQRSLDAPILCMPGLITEEPSVPVGDVAISGITFGDTIDEVIVGDAPVNKTIRPRKK